MKIVCPYCGSDHVVKHGVVGSVTKGERQRYKCQNKAQKCYHTFFVGDEPEVPEYKIQYRTA